MSIPKVKLSVLKEEKRLLKLQLKAKNSLRDAKPGAPGALDSSSTTGVGTATSSLSLSSSTTPLSSELTNLTGPSHLGDETSTSQATNQAGHSSPRTKPAFIKLEPLKVEELPLPKAPSATSTPGPIRPSKLEALQASRTTMAGSPEESKLSRGRRSVLGAEGGVQDAPGKASRGSERPASTRSVDDPVTLLKDELWDESTGQPAYRKKLQGPGGRPSDKALGDYFAEVSASPEPLIIPE